MPAWSGGASYCDDPSRRLLPFGDETVTKGGLDEEVKEAHAAVTGLSSAFGDESRWSVSVTRCPDRDKCLRFSYHRRIACGPYWQRDWTTVDYSWLEALDPVSYGLERDKSTKGAFWCLDPTCTNYYRYLEKPLVRKCCGAPGALQAKGFTDLEDPRRAVPHQRLQLDPCQAGGSQETERQFQGASRDLKSENHSAARFLEEVRSEVEIYLHHPEATHRAFVRCRSYSCEVGWEKDLAWRWTSLQ